MPELIDFAILTFASLFVVVDPVGLIPAFLAMTGQNTVRERIHMATLASVTTFFILLASWLGGQLIFNAFGITLAAFQIAGGIILLLISIDMLQARRTAVKETVEETEEGIMKTDVAITPLAIPMLAGPGAITSVMLLNHKAATLAHQAVLGGNIVLVSVLTFLILWIAAVRSSSFSVIALKITARLMGLILSAIAVQFILNGIQAAGILR